MGKILFVQYPKCGTCQKAAKWLKENNIEVVNRNIADENPSEIELEKWIKLSALPVSKFFNVSGKIYKENNLKEKVKTGTEKELISILASDGMVVKRPIIVGDDFALVGFNEKEWTARLISK